MVHTRKKSIKKTTVKLEDYLEELDIEPTEVHYDLEMSWLDFNRENPKIKPDKRYDKWFKENRGVIKDIVQEIPDSKHFNIV